MSEKRFGGQGGALTQLQWLWHYHNQILDAKEANDSFSSLESGDGSSTGGVPVVKNLGYAAELIEQGASLEKVAELLKTPVETLRNELRQRVPDAIKVD